MTCKKTLLKSVCVLAFVLSCGAFAPSLSFAQAEEKSFVDVLSAATASQSTEDNEPAGEDTHPPLRLTPDKSEIITLDFDAASVVVGNPDHLSVLAESPRLLVVVPKETGASYFTILDAKGAVIMQRHVIVGSPQDNYVRVKKTCQTSSAGNKTQGACKPTSVYYCPDMCHNIGAETVDAGAQDAPEQEAEKPSSDDEKQAKPVYEAPERGTVE